MNPDQKSAASTAMVSFAYGSRRAREARWSRMLGANGGRQMLLFIFFISTLCAFGVFIYGDKAWMLLAAIASVVFVVYSYLSGRLLNNPGHIDMESPSIIVQDSLDIRTLAKLKSIDSRLEVWRAIQGSWRQRFIMSRYQIEDSFLQSNLPDTKEDTSALWSAARELALTENQEQITSASLTVALISTIPGYEKYLAERHLEPLDLVAGIDWQRHIEGAVERAKSYRFRGGITKGSTAGYTPFLNHLAKDLTHEVSSKGFLYRSFLMHDDEINQALVALGQSARPAIAIIGRPGSGKESVVKAIARMLYSGEERSPKRLRFNRIYQINASDLISATTKEISAEKIFKNTIAEAANAKNIILYFHNAQDFFDSEGVGGADFGNLITSLTSNPPLPIILSMRPSSWQQLRQTRPSLSSNLTTINLSQPDRQEVMRTLEDTAPIIESSSKCFFTYQSIGLAYKLADRYMTDSAFPGKGIRAMEAAANSAAGGVVTEEVVRRSFEQTFSVKLDASTDQDRSKLLDLESLLRQRMVGQHRAVKVVSDAMRRAASGLRNEKRPAGSFLFVGPTGVGKTELAKSLAESYFGGESNVIRVDMNQFLSPTDLPRMIDKTSPESLVSKISRSPFSVVLLDEIEKAHPDVINSLLQMLDEGVMQDSGGGSASFRDAVVIATSNAGAREISQYLVQTTEEEKQQESTVVSWLIEHNFFAPEFINRFDEVALFRPLTPEQLLKVVDIQLSGINMGMAGRKISIELTNEAKTWIVREGYDPSLGARPIRRMMQRYTENIIAKKLLSGGGQGGQSFTLDVADFEAEKG